MWSFYIISIENSDVRKDAENTIRNDVENYMRCFFQNLIFIIYKFNIHGNCSCYYFKLYKY